MYMYMYAKRPPVLFETSTRLLCGVLAATDPRGAQALSAVAQLLDARSCVRRSRPDMSEPAFAVAPRFYLYPPNNGDYLRRLVTCGVQQASRCADANTKLEHQRQHQRRAQQQQQRRGLHAAECGVGAAQLINPIAADSRGGLGAEVLLCAAAERHQRRTHNIDEASVVVMCPHLYYQRLLGPGIGRPPPHCPSPDDGERPADRIAAFRHAITTSAAWNQSVPHVYLTNAEFAAGSYSISGRPFGWPAPSFVLHANADVWPWGLGGLSAMVPYMPTVQLMTAKVRAGADARVAHRPLAHKGTRAHARDELLLYFRGTLDFGSARAQLATLAQQNVPGVVFDAPSKEARGRSEWAHQPNEQYAAHMDRSTFCLVPSGHTCNTRRFFDAVAAGCIPVVVDCETSARPFDDRIDYAKFTLFYPLRQIVEAPRSFLHCLQRLQRNASFADHLRQWRRSLRDAREQLDYGYWDIAPNASMSLLESSWELRRDGRVLDNLLITAAMEPSKQSRSRNPWQRSAAPPDRRTRALDVQSLCANGMDTHRQLGHTPAIAQRASGSAQERGGTASGALMGAPSTGEQALAGCWNIYVDVGTNIGVQIRKLYEPEQYPRAPVQELFSRFFGDTKRARQSVCTVGFEASPHHTARLSELQRRYQAMGWRFTAMVETAVSTVDGTASFHFDLTHAGSKRHEYGASLISSKYNQGAKHARAIEVGSAQTTVRTVDLARWLRDEVASRSLPSDLPAAAGSRSTLSLLQSNHFPQRPQLLMKLDIEGSEYSVLPQLVQTGMVCLFDMVFVEFHAVSAAVLAAVGVSSAEAFHQQLVSNISATPGCERTKIAHLDDETYEHDGVPWPSS